MFQGSFPYHVDDKGRLKMPAEFVPALGNSFTVTRGASGCLWAMPEAEWQAVAARLRGETLVDQRLLTLQRYFIGSAVTVTLDGQGRLSLPGVLREFAGIQREVIVVGTGTRVEIWSRERWDQYEQQLSDELIEELARSAGL
ncbi:MAG: division/cell wall cluster transcriptional repressor MraZ [Armatimonadota bacterium]